MRTVKTVNDFAERGVKVIPECATIDQGSDCGGEQSDLHIKSLNRWYLNF